MRELHKRRFEPTPFICINKILPLHQPSDVVSLCWLTKNMIEIRNGWKARSKRAPPQVHPHYVSTKPLIQYANFSPHFTFRCKSRIQNSRKFYSFFLSAIYIHFKYMIISKFFEHAYYIPEHVAFCKLSYLIYFTI